MVTKAAPSDQKFRPIVFLLDDVGVLSAPVNLSIRPEDLTRNEPSRAVVHQTLGRETIGWVDNFGEGLPSVSISGHTGWRTSEGSGMDGVAAFSALNQMVAHDFHQKKQAAINDGIDPAAVKLIFVDTLDGFAWSVLPTQFTLRRSKSRPLLYQYNINLQALSTDIEAVVTIAPVVPSVPKAVTSLGSAIGTIASSTPAFSSSALGALFGSFSATLGKFTGMAAGVFDKVFKLVTSAKNLVTGAANALIGIASSIAQVGRNVFRAINAILTIPDFIKSLLGSISAAFNEVACILANALKPRKVYQQYTGLYGASNCSSTVGGQPPSPYANQNVFNLIAPVSTAPIIGSSASSSMTSLKSMDTVLAPMPMSELDRHLTNVNYGMAA